MRVLNNYRLVTLLELLEHNAEAFCRLSSLIGQMIIGMRYNSAPAVRALGELGELQRETERLGLLSSTKQLQRIYVAIENNQFSNISSLLEELYNRLRDDLGCRVFVAVPIEFIEYYKQEKAPFGSLVDDAFPHSVEDIAEAAKCLSLGRSTAVIFHLMRAMEQAVAVLSKALGVDLLKKGGQEKTWGALLNEFQAKIDSLPPSDRPKWRESYALLHSVKSAWRNDTMHPKQTYTIEEAHTIYNAVKAFMNDLAPLVS